ncbi:hypothetical protein CW704_03855 [Candidatus Bathyarchaeota archaeon]|nr:MAG: hypothetical protein CW704_03855 [Candidatus Bathyarchaeota archaeon]
MIHISSREKMLRPPLIELAIEYFTRRGYTVEKPKFEETTSRNPKIDFTVTKQNKIHPVMIKDWNRTVGVNVVINLDKASQNKIFSNPILVAEKFSEHAKAYANRRGIMLITRSEIIRGLR